ncbi:UDP-N-acetylmuramoyl-L-alanyl-D-glutamate--2,6-diaminopimelate ligase [Thalassotalea ponticola]|uniref:UDP-N-acetylmuramoyl-L-alanyl-D-glutamate--2, 6-diaminopimelate ligase n=1 Tax=Thalassotalea ponticola TaxID=1523392 RepID=UPI0025B4094D|nr:UDP-N-acetylmuramoyl-L-alanyl-D-glutamate--2,6-diaminopimelate ligase [Thalassotalea ponticola]MDN3653559.1 UDP-N-acetylmuramoyl-L-alanyl-D-glutamate--2,6-diaminopimelate ligase [Thalassotalea ponticola]
MTQLPARSINQILSAYDIDLASAGFDDSHCGHMVNDSRQVNAGDIFVAVVGTQTDAKQFIDTAVAKGASLVVYQCQSKQQHGSVELYAHEHKTVPLVAFYQLAEILHQLAADYYGQPATKMTLVGVTGTNGKTSCCQLLAQLLDSHAHKTAIIGTLGAGTLDNLVDINNTTPGPTLLQRLLATFAQQHIDTVAMEVSSHALDQKRLNSEMIDIAVFTNLSRDHLDYHGDMQQYAEAKKSLFVANHQQKWVINADDTIAQQWLSESAYIDKTWLFSLQRNGAELAPFNYVIATDIVCHNRGVRFQLQTSLGDCVIESPLLGEFNVANLLAVIAVALIQGTSVAQLPTLITKLRAVAGRMEVFSSPNQPSAVVDYAHTPDGLEQALRSAKQHCQGQLWVVFGCGGDRDKGKRPLMAQVAERYADRIVLTNDNPRTEPAEQIIADIVAGLSSAEVAEVIVDRQQAVLSTLAKAKANDMVLLAGKGHEDYLIIGHQRLDYDERALVGQFYQQREGK